MTTENDDINDRKFIAGDAIYDEGVYPVGYQDPGGVYPRVNYFYESSLNKASRGLIRNSLGSNGGIPTLQNTNLNKLQDGYIPPADNESRQHSTYPHNQVWETPGGHVVELDDTITNERILIKHKSGAGIEIKPDGTVFVSSTADVLISAGNDQHVVVEGNAHMTYQGDLNVDVAGDYNLSVGGNKLQIITGDHISEIDGARKSNIALQDNLTVKGHQSTTVAQSKTDTTLGGYLHAVKGNFEQSVEGDIGIFSSGAQQITSQVRQNMTSPDTNIHATNLSVFGDEGTIGGENIVGYLYNLHLGHSIWAGDGAPQESEPRGGAGTLVVDTIKARYGRIEYLSARDAIVDEFIFATDINSTTATASTFYGDLNGTAQNAVVGGTDTDPGSSHGFSVNSVGVSTDDPGTEPLSDDTKATALPTNSVSTEYKKSEYGIREVLVDPEGELLRMINQTTLSGGVSNRPLTTGEVRSKLRDDNNKENVDFTAKQVAEQKINPEALGKTVPAQTGRIASGNPTVSENYTTIGPDGPGGGPR